MNLIRDIEETYNAARNGAQTDCIVTGVIIGLRAMGWYEFNDQRTEDVIRLIRGIVIIQGLPTHRIAVAVHEAIDRYYLKDVGYVTPRMPISEPTVEDLIGKI